MIELFFEKDKGTYVIRNGLFRNNCCVDKLSEQNLMTLHRKISKIMKIPDWKAEMEADKKKYL